MTIKSFFKIPLVHGLTHILIVLFFFLNISYFYEIWQEDARITESKEELTLIQEMINDFQNPDNYLSSDYYKEKYAKQQLNMKKEGEKVLDTSSFEGIDTASEIEYIPKETETKKTNVEKWIDCFFSEKRDECIKD